MSFQLNLPPSALSKKVKNDIKELGEEGDEPRKQSREEWKKERELEEMRKAGTAPAMLDEEGKDINPHIPQYIMQAPWYFGTETATLRHQRQQDEKVPKYTEMGLQYKKGVKQGPVAVKFRKGACENCGAMTHKKRDCLERPRKIGAKFTGEMIAPDEHIVPVLKQSFEGKRDGWNMVDAEEHQRTLQEEYNKVEEAKRSLKEQSLDASLMIEEEGEKNKEKDSDDEDEDKYTEEMDMPGQKFETKQRITVRNLRIREDTAKYLYNLDINSAYYDPKTRSMRENPQKNTSKEDITELKFGGDNFVRYSGDAQNMAKRQLFAWQAFERGNDIHLQADPTKLELLHKEFKKRKGDFKDTAKNTILDKYGGEEHLEAPPKQLLLAQTEDYVEYSRHGAVIKGQEKAAIRSRYEEDVCINNHTGVWGSYWKDGKWGFGCCHSILKESYCTGEAGKEAEAESLMLPPPTPSTSQTSGDHEETLLEKHRKKLDEKQKEKDEKKRKKRKQKKRRKKKRKQESSSSSSDSSSSSSSEEDEEDEELKRKKDIKKAMAEQKAHDKKIDKMLQLDERKRPYNSMIEVSVPTDAEIEAFRLRQRNADDPMSKFLQ